MALPSSGSISLNQVNVELNRSGTQQISLGESAVRTLFGVASGAISMSDGYGKSNYQAQWTGSSIYYSNWGVVTSGSNFYFRANGGNGTTLTAYTNGSFTTGTSIGASTGDLNGIGYTGSVFTAYVNGSLQSYQNMTFSIANKFTGVSGDNSTPNLGFQTSGGSFRCKNGNSYGGFITLN